MTDMIEQRYSQDAAEPRCPSCHGSMEKVEQGSPRMLNADQYDATKPGDWFCRHCIGDRGKSGYLYLWDREVILHDRRGKDRRSAPTGETEPSNEAQHVAAKYAGKTYGIDYVILYPTLEQVERYKEQVIRLNPHNPGLLIEFTKPTVEPGASAGNGEPDSEPYRFSGAWEGYIGPHGYDVDACPLYYDCCQCPPSEPRYNAATPGPRAEDGT